MTLMRANTPPSDTPKVRRGKTSGPELRPRAGSARGGEHLELPGSSVPRVAVDLDEIVPALELQIEIGAGHAADLRRAREGKLCPGAGVSLTHDEQRGVLAAAHVEDHPARLAQAQSQHLIRGPGRFGPRVVAARIVVGPER